jgi:multicomponent Na+:H+ antiporter subunit A
MILSLVLFGALSLIAPLLTRLLGRRVFLVLALLPAAVFVVLLTWLPGVLAGTPVIETIEWIPALDIALSFRMDALALLLSLIVTGIGALVLVYCTWYFSDREPSLGRFAALLLAFAGVMLGLVTSDDVFILFTFWEATSVLSYLLIGHYTGRKESRGAALQALTVTTFGGLAMLVGLVLLAVEGGTTSLSELVENPVLGAAGEWGIALVLIGAISKSALVPFHFWLPAAMAAPTPVSAYLHAAAMVKAGVYLVARLAPGYADLEVWHPIIVVLGATTMLVGGWRALRQYDIKLLLAYGTVSQLGFLVLITGFGTRDAALAGVAMLLAHAMFKAALFLVVGIVDHAAGTRDWRKLSGVGRRMPVIATVAILAAASMAGLPPLIGFVAKEAVFGAFLESAAGGTTGLAGWAWLALIGAFFGSVLTVAYSVRFVWGAFWSKPSVPSTELHRESPLIAVAPAVLAVASVAAAFAIGAIEPLFTAYADELPGPLDYHLALWHGFEPALMLSIAVFVLGGLLVWGRARVARMQASVPQLVDSGRGYLRVVSAVDRFAAAITTAIQKRGLPGYVAVIVLVFIGGLGASAIANTVWPGSIRLWDYPSQPFLAFVMAVAAIAATFVQQRMSAVLLVSVTGYGLVLLFGMSGAPDLALTQALVETVTVVVFVLVLRRLPKQIGQRNPPVHPVARGIVGGIAGLVMAVIGFIALGARIQPTIAEGLPALAVEAHGKNIVNVMLVDIRAWDTLGEISVLVAVATGVASLIFVSGRTGGAPRLDDGEKSVRRDRIRPLPEAASSIGGARRSVADTAGEEHASGEDSDTRQTWLLAGRTLSPRRRSILIEVLVRLLFHPAIVVSVYLLFVGHNQPGGGFAGGLLAGIALVARYLAGGRYELGEAAPVDAGRLLGSGLLLAAGTAASSLVFGLTVFESSWFEVDVPVLGTLSIGTSTLFDIGVYLVVVGLVLDILRALGAEVDRQQEEADEASGDDSDNGDGSGVSSGGNTRNGSEARTNPEGVRA